jgi:hypothetical protein
MAIISNGTTVASGGAVRGSGANLSNLPSSAPSNSDILSAVGSASAGAVGSYVIFTTGSFGKSVNETFATNNAMYYTGINYNPGDGAQPSGTWRAMSVIPSNQNSINSTGLFLRIS